MQELDLPRCTSIREETVSLNNSDFEEIIQKDDGILEYDSLSDDGDIPSLERKTDLI